MPTVVIAIAEACPSSALAWRRCEGQDPRMALVSKAIDAIDHRILGALRDDGRLSWRELGERVHLSATSAAERVRRLEQAGVVTGYRADIDQAALGRDLRAVIEVSLPATTDPEAFEALVSSRDEFSFAAFVTGTADYVLVADCAGAEGLNELIRWLKANGGVRTESRVVLRKVVG
jgi:Lrp/AsnC family transcriptional regulator, leucine-responsive regulatory protein